ncbi:MAG: DUF433 domain-containing protein [Calothrix sp. MO_192.B10]|nr:DUF433 domain-containing protein [Calothrix sp. MO_192.B10]
MNIQELENQILALRPTEKAAIIQSLTQSINIGAKGITKTPGVCGREACITGTRIAIWLLVEARRLGITEVQLLQDYPHISAADLVNAWIYADAYPEEIEAAIRANQAA